MGGRKVELENSGKNTVEIVVRKFGSINAPKYLNPGEALSLTAFLQLDASSPEDNDFEIYIENNTDLSRIEVFVAQQDGLSRARSIYPGQQRTYALAMGERLLILPTVL